MENPFAQLLFVLLISVLVLRSFSLSFDYHPLGSSQQQSLISKGNVSFQPNSVQLAWSNNSSPLWNVGRLYNSDQLLLWDDASGEAVSFNCSFQFRFQTSSASIPGDGLAFFLLGPSSFSLPDAHDVGGAGLGLFNIFNNNGSASNEIVAVEFDIVQNVNFLDPSWNHIGIDVNSIISSEWQGSLDFSLASSTSVYAWVDYSSSQSLLDVYATNLSGTKPSSPLLSSRINLTQYLPQYVYVGFSASTGNFFQNHSVLSWSFHSTNTSAPGQEKKGSKTGLFAGLGVGLLIILSPLALLGLHIARRKRTRRPSDTPRLDFSGLPSLSPATGPREFTFRELTTATKHFSHALLLGQGGFGHVYKGVLSEDGSEVAVKCISQKSAQGGKEFLAEVNIISRIRHRHLVQLKGWCRDKGNLLLVYEFLPKGSLDHYLFDKAGASTLDWSTRYRIVCGLGSALQYLHEECEKVILHRDIKASNVMLDSNLNAKLGDFGLARQLGEGAEGRTTLAAGTLGYMAPESCYAGRATTESDVYSFGAVLLEVGCGRRPVDRSLPEEYEDLLLAWVWDLHAKGGLKEAADARLNGDFDERELHRMLIVGLACSHPDPKSRPTIRVAVDALQERVPLPVIPSSRPVDYVRSMSPQAAGDDVSSLLSKNYFTV